MNIQYQTLNGQSIACIDDDSHITKWIRASGRLDHDPMIATLAAMIPPGSIALDVGASIGDHTIAYLRRAAQVIAFEPNPVAYHCLKHNCPTAICMQLAVGDTHGAPLYWHSAAPNYGASWLSGEQLAPADIRVDSTTLDTFFRSWRFEPHARVGYIKADVEGFEVALLRGARATIGLHRPLMCFEVNAGALQRAGTSEAELLRVLAEYGYTVGPVPGTERNAVQWDALCMPT